MWKAKFLNKYMIFNLNPKNNEPESLLSTQNQSQQILNFGVIYNIVILKNMPVQLTKFPTIWK